jgi:hypothetical protein
MAMLFNGKGSFFSDGNFAPRLIRVIWKLAAAIHLLDMWVETEDSFRHYVDKTI